MHEIIHLEKLWYDLMESIKDKLLESPKQFLAKFCEEILESSRRNP